VKVCTRCGESKPLTAFAKHKLGRDGLRPRCRACTSIETKAHDAANRERKLARQKAYREANKEALREKDRTYRAAKPEVAKERGAKWRATFPDRERERGARYRAENKAKDAERKAAYAKANPHVARAIQARRRARKLAVGGTYTVADIAELFRRQRGQCPACRGDLGKFHVDHVLPLALGGDNSPANLQLLCAHCNHTKSAAHPVDFMQRKGFLL